MLHGPSEEWRLRLSPESCKFTKKTHTIIAPAPPCTRRDDEEAAAVAGHEVVVRGVLLSLSRCKRCIVVGGTARMGDSFRGDGRHNRRVNTNRQAPKYVQAVNREVDSPLISQIRRTPGESQAPNQRCY